MVKSEVAAIFTKWNIKINNIFNKMQILDFGVQHKGFCYDWRSDVVRKYFRH